MFVQEGGFKHIDGSSGLTQELQACAATGWVAAGAAFYFQGFWACISGEMADFCSILFSCLHFLFFK